MIKVSISYSKRYTTRLRSLITTGQISGDHVAALVETIGEIRDNPFSDQRRLVMRSEPHWSRRCCFPDGVDTGLRVLFLVNADDGGVRIADLYLNRPM